MTNKLYQLAVNDNGYIQQAIENPLLVKLYNEFGYNSTDEFTRSNAAVPNFAVVVVYGADPDVNDASYTTLEPL